jgi:hypothetical protein
MEQCRPMQHLSRFLFGSLAPALEVLLVLAGLGLLGWEGVMYTLTGVWPSVTLGALWLGAAPGPLLAWVLATPLSGACIGTAVALFFVAPPAYAHA